jgi:hypothetical protein
MSLNGSLARPMPNQLISGEKETNSEGRISGKDYKQVG